MFEKYIEQKEQNLADQINLTADYVNLFEMIFNPKIEQAYKSYFSAEVDWWLYEEQIARTSNLRFNFDDPKLNSFLHQMDELYKKNARFSTVSLPLVISSAVKARMNYLCRPRTALKWFVYRWDQTKTYHEIIKRLNYLDDYKYLTEGFVNYVRSNNVIKTHDDLINMSMFDKIINEIDNLMLADLSPEGFVQLMGPLFAFFNSDADHQDTAKIPVEAVIVFFDDKNMMSLSTKLESAFRSGELLLISKKYLLGFIYKSLYDADNRYGGGEDNITKVTNEIEQVNHSFMNIANSLKENIAKNQDYLAPEELTHLNEENLQPELIEDEDVSEPQIEPSMDFNLSNLNLSSFSNNLSKQQDEILPIPEEIVDDTVQEVSDEFDLSAFGFTEDESGNIVAEATEAITVQQSETQTPKIIRETYIPSEVDSAMINKIADAANNKNINLKSLLDTLMKEIVQ